MCSFLCETPSGGRRAIAGRSQGGYGYLIFFNRHDIIIIYNYFAGKLYNFYPTECSRDQFGQQKYHVRSEGYFTKESEVKKLFYQVKDGKKP